MPIQTIKKQLAQKLPATTSTTTLYTVPSQLTQTFIKTIIVTNTTGSSATYSIWINQGGTTTGDQFAFVKNRTISANATDQFIYSGDAAIILNGDNLNSSASIMISSSVGSALTFTLFGQEIVLS